MYVNCGEKRIHWSCGQCRLLMSGPIIAILVSGRAVFLTLSSCSKAAGVLQSPDQMRHADMLIRSLLAQESPRLLVCWCLCLWKHPAPRLSLSAHCQPNSLPSPLQLHLQKVAFIILHTIADCPATVYATGSTHLHQRDAATWH